MSTENAVSWAVVFDKVSLAFDEHVVLRDISFSVPKGSMSILLGAMMGNALDAIWMPVEQRSIGASTAVFAALGVLSAYAWMIESATNLRWAKRLGPLIAGVILLGFLGAGGERTDVVAHVTGFASGCLLGLLLGIVPERYFDSRAVQLATGAFTLATIVGAWLIAMR